MESSTENIKLFICKLLIYCFSIRSLHGAGFVHVKIWSSSIGRGATVWQLYNFQDSQQITEINEHMKYEDYYYLTLACICSVNEIVDVKGEPFKFVLEPVIVAKQPLKQLQLDQFFKLDEINVIYCLRHDFLKLKFSFSFLFNLVFGHRDHFQKVRKVQFAASIRIDSLDNLFRISGG